MSGVERDTRTNLFGVHWWKLDLGTEKRRHRQLVLEPYAPLSGHVTQLNAWIEEEHTQYVWTSNRPDLPTDPPAMQATWHRIDASMLHGCVGIPSLGYTIIEALSRNELVGESAAKSMHGLFWAAFVENRDGLDYLCRYASTETGDFYARQQLHWELRTLARMTRKNSSVSEAFVDQVAQLMYDIGSAQEPLLCLRTWQRASVDDAFYDALSALATSGTDSEQRTKEALAFLRSHKSRRDTQYAIANAKRLVTEARQALTE